MQDDELIETLRSLAPAEAKVDPIAAAFVAGRRSRRPELVALRSAAAGLLAACGLLLIPAPPRAAVVPPVTVAQLPPPEPLSVIRLQQAVLDQGLDALGRPPARTTSPIRIGDPIPQM